MRRICGGLVASGLVLLATGGIGVVGSWALVTGVIVLTASAIAIAVVMEEVEHSTRPAARSMPTTHALDTAG